MSQNGDVAKNGDGSSHVKDCALNAYKVAKLKDELSKRGMKTTGVKADLVARLQAAMTLDDDRAKDEKNENDEDDTEDENEDCESSNDDAINDENDVLRRADYVPNFKDVEESMDTFNGDGKTNVKRWVKDFEETAKLCKWTDIQKIIYAKRLLRGPAKLFVNFEKCCKTWKQMKKALCSEFSINVTSHQVHKQLSSRRKKSSESYQEYIYEMLNIAAEADVEAEAVIQYIIDGVPDDELNKAVLYGAKNIQELKGRFHQYEKMKTNHAMRAKTTRPDLQKKKIPDGQEKRCFNCGGKSHVSTECPSKDKGRKCFQCNDFGHVAAKCPKKGSCNFTQVGQGKYCKDVVIADQNVKALIDTGSDISLIRAEQYVRIGAPDLQDRKISFRGVGSANITTLGQTRVKAIIDDESFEILLHVIPDALLPYEMVIGSEFLRTVEFHQKNGNIFINKIKDEILDIPHVFTIDICDDTNELSMTDIKDEKVRSEIENIVGSYTPNKTRDVNIEMRIILKDEVPVYSRPRRLSQSEKEEVNKQLRVWLDERIIKPSYSEYASPVVLVKKRDGNTRICVDYRKLNEKIIKDRYPLPLIEDQIDRLQSAKIFSVIDLKNGFFHTAIEESSIKYTAFVVPDGHYEFLRVPFGLCNSPAVFQRFVNAIFKDLIAAGTVLVYMDDLILPTEDYDTGLCSLKVVLKRASEYGLQINWNKCHFMRKNVEYLGHVIEGGRVRPSERKTLAVERFPKPTSIKTVQSFLGLTGFFRKFIPLYSVIARPLTNLLRKDVKFRFEAEEYNAFIQLKQALVNKPVLRLYRVNAETELHTNACMYGYGAIILQRDNEDNKFHPIYYSSGKTSACEEKYTSYELEMLAIVKALKKFRVYLLGISFKIVTDCRAFTLTMQKKDICPRIARWALMLEEFQYKVEHRPGSRMTHVDALSRNPLPTSMTIVENHESVTERLSTAQRKDKKLVKIIDELKRGSVNGYVMQGGLLHKEVKDEMLIVVPKLMQTSIIRRSHEQGHFAIVKTEEIIKRDYWFDGMRTKIEKVVRNCIDCILAEKKSGKQEGLLHPLYKGGTPLETYHVDHLGPLPSTRKNCNHIFAVVDSFTKFVWLYPTKSTGGKEVVDRLKKQAAIFGNPGRIISDRGTAFTSNEFEEYCKEEGIHHALITTGVPRGNGQIERINKILIPILTKLAAPNAHEWYKFVDRTQQYLNSTMSRSTGHTPFNLLCGAHMRLKEQPQIREILETEQKAMFQERRDEMRDQAMKAISRIQEQNRRNYNKRRKEPSRYDVNSLIAIKRTQFGPGLKLRAKFLGPYRITKVLRGDRYLVEKVGEHEGPFATSTAAEFIKPWINYDDNSTDSEDDETAEDGC